MDFSVSQNYLYASYRVKQTYLAWKCFSMERAAPNPTQPSSLSLPPLTQKRIRIEATLLYKIRAESVYYLSLFLNNFLDNNIHTKISGFWLAESMSINPEQGKNLKFFECRKRKLVQKVEIKLILTLVLFPQRIFLICIPQKFQQARIVIFLDQSSSFRRSVLTP